MEDTAKKRRDYLRKKAIAISTAGGAGVLTIGGAFCAVMTFVSALVFLNYFPYGVFHDTARTLDAKLRVTSMVVLTSAAVGLVSLLFYRDQARAVREIPYVPPVHVQAARLPAVEVPLRGAAEPDGADRVLLRAAAGGGEDLPGELLRAPTSDESENSN
jgi:hypothetical protein